VATKVRPVTARSPLARASLRELVTLRVQGCAAVRMVGHHPLSNDPLPEPFSQWRGEFTEFGTKEDEEAWKQRWGWPRESLPDPPTAEEIRTKYSVGDQMKMLFPPHHSCLTSVYEGSARPRETATYVLGEVVEYEDSGDLVWRSLKYDDMHVLWPYQQYRIRLESVKQRRRLACSHETIQKYAVSGLEDVGDPTEQVDLSGDPAYINSSLECILRQNEAKTIAQVREGHIYHMLKLDEARLAEAEARAKAAEERAASAEKAQATAEAKAKTAEDRAAAADRVAKEPQGKRLKTDFRRDDRIYVWQLVDNQWIKRFGSITTCDTIDNEYDVAFDSVGEIKGEEVRTHGSSIFHVDAASEPPQPRTVVKQEAF
jgi:hypothetical protein